MSRPLILWKRLLRKTKRRTDIWRTLRYKKPIWRNSIFQQIKSKNTKYPVFNKETELGILHSLLYTLYMWLSAKCTAASRPVAKGVPVPFPLYKVHNMDNRKTILDMTPLISGHQISALVTNMRCYDLLCFGRPGLFSLQCHVHDTHTFSVGNIKLGTVPKKWPLFRMITFSVCLSGGVIQL